MELHFKSISPMLFNALQPPLFSIGINGTHHTRCVSKLPTSNDFPRSVGLRSVMRVNIKTMLDQNKLSNLRFSMSEVPAVGGKPGIDEEKWAQWFLERSFFRDFVYRNPRGVKKGQELADAVVLFDDVLIMVQVKAQHGKHEARAWATEKLLEALKQLSKTPTSLSQGHVKSLRNDFYGTMPFDPKQYPNQIGLIILAHDSAPYNAAKLAPEILSAGFPIHVFSLKDFATIASRFDTAGDLITFLELRGDIAKSETFFVQDEEGNINRMIPHVPSVYRAHMSPTTDEIFEKSVRSIRTSRDRQTT